MNAHNDIARRQQWEMVLGFLAFFTVAALIWAVVSIVSQGGSIWPSVALIVLLWCDWKVFGKVFPTSKRR